jgi:hypothetical protein
MMSITKMKMRIYYIGYDYGISGVDMISGPYGTASEAIQHRERLIGIDADNDKLIVVRIIEEVEKVEL